MISYCPNREDVLLWRIFKDKSPQRGFYVDVGACHPTGASITKWFYDLGWNGINLEPGSYFKEFLTERSRDININKAASNRKGTLKFYENPDLIGTSTLQETIHENLQECSKNRIEREVEADTLENIFDEHLDNRIIDFMSIDVESWEKQVIEGNNWNRYRPRVLLVESTEPYSNKLCHHNWEPILLEAGYLYGYFDGINRYYIREEDRELLSKFECPVNVLDEYTDSELVRAWEHSKNIASEFERISSAYEEAVNENKNLKSSPERLGIRALSKGFVRSINIKVTSCFK